MIFSLMGDRIFEFMEECDMNFEDDCVDWEMQPESINKKAEPLRDRPGLSDSFVDGAGNLTLEEQVCFVANC